MATPGTTQTSGKSGLFAFGSIVLCVVMAGCEPNPVEEEAVLAAVWYVQSAVDKDASTPGVGTRDAPFRSFAEVEAAAAPGDEIVVLSPPIGSPPLDGGIALQNGQRLRGAESVGAPPEITNTDPNRRAGDVVTLADDCTVTGLYISGAAGHAIVGRNVNGVVVTGNRIRGGNLSDLTSVTTGATAALGVPEFPKAVVAFLHDGSFQDRVPARPNAVSENEIGGSQVPGQAMTRLGGAGIALLARGSSRASLVLSKNRISDLGAGFQRSGVLVDAQDDAEVSVEIDDTRVANAFGSSDGILLVAQHRSSVTAAIRRYQYVGGTPGIGDDDPAIGDADPGIGNNGLEVVTYYGENWLQGDVSQRERHTAQTKLLMEESDIEGAGGFGVVVWNLFGKPSADTVLDFGGGELGGRGVNRIYNNGTELPLPMDVYVVHHDLNVANNWWGTDRSGRSKIKETDGSWHLDDSFAFTCPGEADQLQKLIDGTGTDAWSTFCQASSDESSLESAPALRRDPRP